MGNGGEHESLTVNSEQGTMNNEWKVQLYMYLWASVLCSGTCVLLGVGPAKGLSLVRQYGSIEEIIANNPKVWNLHAICSVSHYYINAAEFP